MKYMLYFLAVFFPCTVLLIKDNPGGFIVCMVLQASLIGWIPASIWAFSAISESEKKQSKKDTNQQDNQKS